jgi:hypothetical protein
VGIFLPRSFILECENKMLVSSAKITGMENLFNTIGKSFIYRRNNKGPNTDPCGTPCLVGLWAAGPFLDDVETIFLCTWTQP